MKFKGTPNIIALDSRYSYFYGYNILDGLTFQKFWDVLQLGNVILSESIKVRSMTVDSFIVNEHSQSDPETAIFTIPLQVLLPEEHTSWFVQYLSLSYATCKENLIYVLISFFFIILRLTLSPPNLKMSFGTTFTFSRKRAFRKQIMKISQCFL